MTSLSLFTVSFQLTGEISYCCLYKLINYSNLTVSPKCVTLQMNNGESSWHKTNDTTLE